MYEIFQPLETKQECLGIYHEGKLKFDENLPFDNLEATWDYSPNLPENNFKFAKIYCNGKSLNEVCPQNLEKEWKSVRGKLKAYFNSFKHAKISLGEHCFYDLVPENFLYEYYYLQNKITEYVFEKYEKPNNYDFLKNASELVNYISQQTLKCDLTMLDGDDRIQKQLAEKIKKTKRNVEYDIYKTSTGRLTTKSNSFPILNINSDYRDIIKPKNDFLVELDYNSADLRVFLGLVGMEQPKEDIHDWNYENLMDSNIEDRSELKKEIFSWLYNPSKKNDSFEKIYDREKVMNEYFDGKYVKNIYDRKIRSDSYHALSYIIQSTANDIMLESAYEIYKLLSDKKSNISFMVHDSIMLDFCKNELDLLPECAKIMSDTPIGDFKLNAKAGHSWGDMKKVTFNY